MKTIKTLLSLLFLYFIAFNLSCHAQNFVVKFKVNDVYQQCSIHESKPSKSFKKIIFKRSMNDLINNGLSENFLESHVLECFNHYGEATLLEWHSYDKIYYNKLYQYLEKNFKYMEMPINLFPLTIKSNNRILDINRFPCKTFHKKIRDNSLYVGMCEEKIGEIIVRYNINNSR